MPVIFIMSAVVSGIALCMLTYIVITSYSMHYTKLYDVEIRYRSDESREDDAEVHRVDADRVDERQHYGYHEDDRGGAVQESYNFV